MTKTLFADARSVFWLSYTVKHRSLVCLFILINIIDGEMEKGIVISTDSDFGRPVMQVVDDRPLGHTGSFLRFWLTD